MTLRFAVVREADADFRIATDLADRVLCESIDWLDETYLPHSREWVGKSTNGRPLTWATIKLLARDKGIRAWGHFDGESGMADAAAARRAIMYLRDEYPDLHAIVLIRDQDDEPERKAGLEQARREAHGGVTIVVGLAIAKREAWVICGFEPKDGAETERLVHATGELGFDPCHQSHELTATKIDAKHSSKRVLTILSRDDYERELRCWANTPLPTLRARGVHNGLVAYLEEVSKRLVPLIRAGP